jgi:hypothetical protein
LKSQLLHLVFGHSFMGIISNSFQAFKFDGICQTVALSLCPLIGKYDGIEPVCYSRNVDLAGTLIFQPGKR